MRNDNRTNNDISALSCQIRIQDCSSNNITTQKHFKIHKCKSEASHRRQDDTMINKDSDPQNTTQKTNGKD
jgi:hypothetical protein